MSRQLETVHTHAHAPPRGPNRPRTLPSYGASEQLALSSTCVKISDTAVSPR